MQNILSKTQELVDFASILYYRLVPPSSPLPENRGAISGTEIQAMYEEFFPEHEGKIHISDVQFEITSIRELRRFVEWDNTNAYFYQADRHDCDDFAASLAGSFAKFPQWSGFPTAAIWGSFYGGHAFFTAVAWPSLEDRTPTIYYIEPQNDWEIAPEQVEGTDLWLLRI